MGIPRDILGAEPRSEAGAEFFLLLVDALYQPFHDEDAPDAAFGGATPVPAKAISPTDPAARWTAQHGGPAAKRMVERAHDRFGLWPEKLAADTGY